MVSLNHLSSDKLSISFHHVHHSQALEERIQKKAGKLFAHYSSLVTCHVTVDSPHHHKHQGNLYEIRILLVLPGEEIAVTQESGKLPQSHENPFIAVNDAFRAAKQILRKHYEKQRAPYTKGFSSSPPELIMAKNGYDGDKGAESRASSQPRAPG